MARGPGLTREGWKYETDFDTSFRIITDYDVPTDAVLFRFDAKTSPNDQFTTGFVGDNSPSQSQVGVNLHTTQYLITPAKRNGLECINIITNKEELIRALKELLSDLEGIK